jgi:P4 family phage/plasmid primase-like protien
MTTSNNGKGAGENADTESSQTHGGKSADTSTVSPEDTNVNSDNSQANTNPIATLDDSLRFHDFLADELYHTEQQLTEYGFTELFIQRMQDKIRYVIAEEVKHNSWYVWNGHTWHPDHVNDVLLATKTLQSELSVRMLEGELGSDDARERVIRAARKKVGTLATRRNIVAGAAVDRRMKMLNTQLDAHPHLLGLPNGVFDLSLGADSKVQDGRPEDFISLRTGVALDLSVLKTPPPMILDFLKIFMPEGKEHVQAFFRILGSALWGGNRRRLFVIIKGGTTSGKTMLLMAILNALGDYAAASKATVFRENRDDKPRPDVIQLYKKRYVFFAEADHKTWKLQAARVKLFTGGDKDTQRGMRSDVMQSHVPQCIPILYTNDLPTIEGLDPATKRRIIAMFLDHTLPPEREDTTIRERFINDEGVQQWLLAALVQGYIESCDDGLMQKAVDEFAANTAEAVDGMHSLSDFISWVTDGDEPQLRRVPLDGSVPVSRMASFPQLYARYRMWIRDRGDHYDKSTYLSDKDFAKQLRTNHGFEAKKSGEWRWLGWQLGSVPLPDLSAFYPTKVN